MPILPYLNYLWYYRYHIHCLFKLSPEYTNVEILSKETISLKGVNRKNIIEVSLKWTNLKNIIHSLIYI